MPERIQLSRKKGWRMPKNAVSVARPTKWGNPYRHGKRPGEGDTFGSPEGAERIVIDAPAKAVHLFRIMLQGGVLHQWENYPSVTTVRAELRGKNLACWCPLDQPCHGDVLLEIANA